MIRKYPIQTLTDSIFKLLSKRSISVIILLAVIASRIIQQIYFFNTRSDMSYQILGAQHLLNGNGLSQALINSSDLSQTHFIPLNQWPPGFSLLFILFYLLMGKNYILAAITISIVFSIILIFICRAI